MVLPVNEAIIFCAKHLGPSLNNCLDNGFFFHYLSNYVFINLSLKQVYRLDLNNGQLNSGHIITADTYVSTIQLSGISFIVDI